MKCRACGTEIAANALICYRCGTATSEPRIHRRPRVGPLATGGYCPRWSVAAAAAAAAAGGLL